MSETTRYAYVLALKFPLGGPSYAETESKGTLDLAPGSSRHQVFEQIRSTLIESARKQGLPDGAITTFWYLEPDTL